MRVFCNCHNMLYYLFSFLFISDVDSVRLATVLQENAVLKSEMEMLKLKCKNLLEENKRLRQASVNIVSNTCNNIAIYELTLPQGKFQPAALLITNM